MTFVSGVISACDESSPDSGTPSAPTPAKKTIAKEQLPTVTHVPVGQFLVGSRPGAPGREPALEPTERRLKLGPFRIDAYPYPNDPQKPPRTGVTVGEAEALCAEKNGRLCTELEWERACRGSGSSRYPTGDEPCSPDTECRSGFDVAKMTTLLEWTSSSFGNDSPVKGKPVVRGAPATLSAAQRRCARRTAAEKDDLVGFRCCYGAPNAASIHEPKDGQPFREVKLEERELRELLESDPKTAELADGARLFKPEAAATVLARGPGNTMGFKLTTSAVSWQPAQGSRFLVAAGKNETKRTSFVVVYHVASNLKTLAGSFIMDNEAGPISLAYANSIRPRIHFSGCWGCPGETGKVLFRPPEQVVLLQP